MSTSVNEDRWTICGLVTDASAWPLVVETMPATFLSEEDTAKWLERRGRIGDRGKFVLLMDTLPTIKPAAATQRKQLAEFFDSNDGFNQSCVGIALVIDSIWVRGALTALTWVSRPAQPWVAVKTWDQALARCEQMLASQGLSPSDAMLRFVRSRAWEQPGVNAG